ncbi:MAG: M1 family metallopeptidase [Flavobacteriales bacterium]|jgi:hypothetical protein|nr:M1 family metallopeptidase [Flavobacteriales bacterium]
MKNLFFLSLFAVSIAFGQNQFYNNNKFKQLKQELATPNVYRAASGAPGHQYYQNNAHYWMSIELDDENQSIKGDETIEYVNNSPDNLEYLWLQLDQNIRKKDSDSKMAARMNFSSKTHSYYLKRMHTEFDGGFKIEQVTSASGKKLDYTINKTMMRIDLVKPLKPGQKYKFKIKWNYNINDRDKLGGRSGLEYFKKEDNYLYTIAQFFPRMCVYSDIEGWQNKQFLGNGEFALPFGNYDVKIKVPSDHIVSATGVLQNAKSVLTKKQLNRFNKAKKTYDKPVFIVTEEEAIENEKEKATRNKTWHFKAKNVRDFAFASSRKFIWDAMAVKQQTKDVLAMSFYPKEGNPLWEKYSTHAVAQTLETYSRHTFDYPYPVAISVHTKSIGMEYPMICFNGGRPEADGTYSARTKYGMISVIIHEVGHNYFPMIINSDERQWTWMDEGLNTFLQFLTEQDWDLDYPSRRGPAHKIVGYMKGEKSNIMPIMTNSESLLQFGNNAYGKPATALNILRETIMGRELFDHAFKTYAQRWMFKHPSPADFFRTMEDASGVDLDWFWRGWFFTNEHVDIALNDVRETSVKKESPKEAYQHIKEDKETLRNKEITYSRNKKRTEKTRLERYPELRDFYNDYDADKPSKSDLEAHETNMNHLEAYQKTMLENEFYYYAMDFENIGGLVMPIILEFTFEDGSKETKYVPAEFWVKDNVKGTKTFWFTKKVTQIELDPFLETADVDRNNNHWPSKKEASRFEIFKKKRKSYNPMRDAQ